MKRIVPLLPATLGKIQIPKNIQEVSDGICAWVASLRPTNDGIIELRTYPDVWRTILKNVYKMKCKEYHESWIGNSCIDYYEDGIQNCKVGNLFTLVVPIERPLGDGRWVEYEMVFRRGNRVYLNVEVFGENKYVANRRKYYNNHAQILSKKEVTWKEAALILQERLNALENEVPVLH